MFKEKPTCFVAIPGTPDFASVRDAVQQSLQNLDVEPSSATDIVGTTLSTKAIERSDFLIADVTDKNPDTFYEVGLADAMRKPILILAQKSHDVPTDLGGHRVLLYEPGDTDKLTRYLDYWIQEQASKG